MSKKVLMVLAALLVAASFTAFAQDQAAAETETDYFAKWDADANGSLSKEEFSQGYATDIPGTEYEDILGAGASVDDLFAQADTDANGEISAEEFKAAVELL